MDLTFLPLPNDMCRIISKMKLQIESGTLMKEIRERKLTKYKYNNNYVPTYLNTSSGVEWMVAYIYCIGGSLTRSTMYLYTNNPTLYRLTDDRTIRSVKWHLSDAAWPNASKRTNAIKINPATLANLKAYLRDNNIKGYSKLRKDELRKLCLSF